MVSLCHIDISISLGPCRNKTCSQYPALLASCRSQARTIYSNAIAHVAVAQNQCTIADRQRIRSALCIDLRDIDNARHAFDFENISTSLSGDVQRT